MPTYNGSTIITGTLYENGSITVKNGVVVGVIKTSQLKQAELFGEISKKPIMKEFTNSITDNGNECSHVLKPVELLEITKKVVIITP